MSNTKKKLIILGSFIFILLLGTLISLEKIDFSKLKGDISGVGNQDRIHFINVGTGDCTLIESQGQYALIDAGEYETAYSLMLDDGYIKRILGDKKLKYIILTHNHTDHSGGLYYAAREYADANTIFYFGISKALSGEIHNLASLGESNKLKWILDEMSSKGAKSYQLIDGKQYLVSKISEGKYSIPTTGDNFRNDFSVGNFNIKILNTENDTGPNGPTNDQGAIPANTIPGITKAETSYGDGNKDSIIELVTHVPSGKKTLLTGDMQVDDEYRFLCTTKMKNNGVPCRSNSDKSSIQNVSIIKLGHHGSYTSSSVEFLKHTNPSIAIVPRGDMAYYEGLPYGAIDAYSYLIREKQVPIYFTSFDINDNNEINTNYEEAVKKANKEAIIATFSSGNPVITSSGYDLSKALLNNNYTYVTEDSGWEKWNIFGNSHWIYRKDDSFVRGGSLGNYRLSDRNVLAKAGITVAVYQGHYRAYPIDSNGEYQYDERVTVNGETVILNTSSTGGYIIGKVESNGSISNSFWIKDYNKGYIYIDNEEVVLGWKKIDNAYYYFSSGWHGRYTPGEMYSNGFHILDNNIYYFNSNGSMATGNVIVKGTTYTFNSSGYLINSSVSVDNVNYYCDNNGSCKKMYKIVFKCGEGTGTPPDEMVIKTGDAITIPTSPRTCEKEGYTFNGWNTKMDGTGSHSWTGYSGTWTTSTYYNNYGLDNYTLTLFAEWQESVPAKLKTGQEVNKIMKTLAFGSNTNYNVADNGSIKRIKKAETLTSSDKQVISTNDSETPVYMWYDSSTKTIYYYSDSNKIYLNSNSSYLFSGLMVVESIDLDIFDTSNVTNMSYMFYGCNAMESLDLRTFDTSNVTNMSYMFYLISDWKINNLRSINLSSFNTSKVINMSNMFSYCYNLQSLDLSSFNTGNVTNMASMFQYATSITTLDLSGFDTSKVTNMASMFNECHNLTLINLSSFDTSNVTDMNYMFGNLYSITSITITNFNTSKVTNMGGMFIRCYALKELDLSSFNTRKVTSMVQMFEDDSSLKTIYASNTFTLDSIRVNTDVHGEDTSNMFRFATSLVGGNGTTYSGNGYAFAHIDGGESNPGYFTYKSTEPFYTINYNCGEGEGIAPSTQIITSSNNYEFTVSENAGTCNKEGYTFNGWNTASDGSGYDSWTPGSTWNWDASWGNNYGIVDGTVTLYAQWKQIGETFTVNYNCGTGVAGTPPSSVTGIQDGDRFTVSENAGTCSKSGYILSDWKTSKGDSWKPGSSWDWTYKNGEYGIENYEVTLYAVWEKAPSSNSVLIKFNCGTNATGEGPKNITITDGKTLVIPNTPSACKNGDNVFIGWNTKVDGTGDTTWDAGGVWKWKSEWNTSYGIVDNQVTLYAQWKTRSGVYLAAKENANISVGKGAIKTSIPKGTSYLSSEVLNSYLDKSSGWGLYNKNGKQIGNNNSSVSASILNILASDNNEDIVTTESYYSNESNPDDKFIIVIKGDIVEDGKVGIKDMYQSYLLYKGKDAGLNNYQVFAADYDESGILDIKDLYQIYLKMKGKD